MTDPLKYKRRETTKVFVGNIALGSGEAVRLQSMTNTDTRDISSTVNQILELQDAGCEIIRVAVLDLDAAAAITAIRDQITIPLIADIHFDHRLAVASMEYGAQGIRINPGNIG